MSSEDTAQPILRRYGIFGRYRYFGRFLIRWRAKSSSICSSLLEMPNHSDLFWFAIALASSERLVKPTTARLVEASTTVIAAPASIFAQLLDEGRFLCSIRTMYRLLKQSGQVRKRRDQLTHPPYGKP